MSSYPTRSFLAPPVPIQTPKTARVYDSKFPQAALTYHGISAASDGKIYYALTTEVSDVGVRMFRLDPATGVIDTLADLTEVCGEQNTNAIVQGKVHTNFHEANGKLYFATHLGFYQTLANGREVEGTPPPGVKPYPGGHFLSYDLRTGKFDNIAIAPGGEGIIAIALDYPRGVVWGLSWPSGNMLRCDLASRTITNLGPTSAGGEKADPPDYRTLCRTLAIDPLTGNIHLSTADGLLMRVANGVVQQVPDFSLQRAILGQYDIATPGELGWNWRQTVYYAPEHKVYAVHGRTGFLFSFSYDTYHVEFHRRITAETTDKSGVFDLERHGYLSFRLGPDDQTIYYLTGAFINPQEAAAGKENLHLVTFSIPTKTYTDQGPILLETGGPPSGINSIAITGKQVYSISRIATAGASRVDLIGFDL
jgi:hypothetical protein